MSTAATVIACVVGYLVIVALIARWLGKISGPEILLDSKPASERPDLRVIAGGLSSTDYPDKAA